MGMTRQNVEGTVTSSCALRPHLSPLLYFLNRSSWCIVIKQLMNNTAACIRSHPVLCAGTNEFLEKIFRHISKANCKFLKEDSRYNSLRFYLRYKKQAIGPILRPPGPKSHALPTSITSIRRECFIRMQYWHSPAGGWMKASAGLLIGRGG
jgi:hypothetical protein